ncbi:MAG: sugar transferase [Marinicaulis sp.]|nr:sugar transferase [Marinicaulis sp.]
MGILTSSLIAGSFILVAARSGVWLLNEADLAKSVRPNPQTGSQRHPVSEQQQDHLDIETVDIATVEAAAAQATGRKFAPVKRAMDIAVSLALIGFLAPLLLLTAIAIKLDSRGPLLYRQCRVGYRGREFSVYKFRSMTIDAEKNGPQYASKNDARITRVGWFIRKTRIDEIPQTINVLRGEMSFVGPRPERPEFVQELEKEIPHYQKRHLVKPGITGWAQVRYEYAASVEGAREKLKFDLFYIKNFSPLFDIDIIFRTVRVALFGLGSR